MKLFLIYGDLIHSLTTGVIPYQLIGLPIVLSPQTSLLMRSSHLDIEKQIIISEALNHIKNSGEKFLFTEKEIYQLYNIAVKYKNTPHLLTNKQLILELRGGTLLEWAAATCFVGTIIMIMEKFPQTSAFVVRTGGMVLTHVATDLEWFYNNGYPGNNFGYGNFGYRKGAGGPRTITVTKAESTQNGGSQKKDPYNYNDVME
jgi:hypothetical protein